MLLYAQMFANKLCTYFFILSTAAFAAGTYLAISHSFPALPFCMSYVGTSTATAEVCRVGDAVQAIYQGNGNLYSAYIAHIDGDSITVTWSDGDAHFKHINSKSVYKNAATCWSLTGKLNALTVPRDEQFIFYFSYVRTFYILCLACCRRSAKKSDSKHLPCWRRSTSQIRSNWGAIQCAHRAN